MSKKEEWGSSGGQKNCFASLRKHYFSSPCFSFVKDDIS